jgi:hypothetical protein
MKLRILQSLFPILLFTLLLGSCDGDQQCAAIRIPTSSLVVKKVGKLGKLDPDSCRILLANDIVEYIQFNVNKTIDERTNPYSFHSIRMVKDAFWTDSIVRYKEWDAAFKTNGLSPDSIEKYINDRIGIYNKICHANFKKVRFHSTKHNFIDQQSFSHIKTLDRCGAYDVLEIILTIVCISIPFLGFIIVGVIYFFFFPIGFFIGYVLSAIGVSLSKDGAKALAAILVTISMGSIFLFLMYLCIQASGCLESQMIINYINYLSNQDIPNQL